jgi:hypothetical protein
LTAEPITHTVFFTLKPGSASIPTQDFYQEALKLATIPGVEDFRWVEETSPKNNFDYGLIMDFADQAAYEAYNVHPDHVYFVEAIWIPNVAEFMEVDWVADAWVALLDPDLSQWEVWTGVPHTTVKNVPEGVVAADKIADGTPVGLGDPFGLFSVEQSDAGETLLKVSGEVYAGLTTLKSYENYHLTLQYKWGEQKWEPRLNAKRDSGLLYHCYGEHGAFWQVWKRCLELQIQEGDTGDLHQLAGPSSMVRLDEDKVWDPQAEAVRRKGRGIRSEDQERAHGDWNRVDLYVYGDRAVHVVNGEIVLALTDAIDHEGNPLTSGQIQLQSEGAELFYKDIRIRPIGAFPASVQAAFTAKER